MRYYTYECGSCGMFNIQDNGDDVICCPFCGRDGIPRIDWLELVRILDKRTAAEERDNLVKMDKRELAEWLHNEYEEIAVEVGWETQDGTSVPFDELPEDNKQVMLQLADRLLTVYDFQKNTEGDAS